jgi:hypothetical protein
MTSDLARITDGKGPSKDDHASIRDADLHHRWRNEVGLDDVRQVA